MSRVISNIIPPQGWHYKDPQGYRVPASGEAYSEPDLQQRLMDYRLENNMPVGDVRGDIERYLCETFPHMCSGADNSFANEMYAKPMEERSVDTVSNWANNLYSVAPSLVLVPEKEAHARAEVCKECPFNEPWEGQCPPCVSNAQRLLALARQGRDLPQAAKLHYCKHHRFCTRTAVWMDRKHFSPQMSSPGNCWMK